MKLLLQRVEHASVIVDGAERASIGAGLLILVGIGNGDTQKECARLAEKAAKLRIFDDSDGVMNLSVSDIGGEVLAVSQFTLMASTRKGNRPSYIDAARGDVAEPLYEFFVSEMERFLGCRVQKGVFGADMKVELVNDGPVTIIIESV